MSFLENAFPLGLGTNRFPISGVDDYAGIEKSVGIVTRALEIGVNYIDVAANYSRGLATHVLKEALSHKNQTETFITYKYKYKYSNNYDIQKNASQLRSDYESFLRNIGLGKVSMFLAWSISSYDEFEKITALGSVYEAAEKMKREGLFEHITCSCHAPVEDTIKIIRSRAFEAITISFSMLNASTVQPILDAADENNVDIITMNSLGAGIIPKNAGFFSFAKYNDDESVACAGLRFVKAHDPVKVVLTGPADIDELEDNVKAFNSLNMEENEKRMVRVNKQLSEIKGFCSGCGYCMPCPQEIPISDIMYHRNALLFGAVPSHNRTDREVIENINILSLLERDTGYLPYSYDNPCIRCGACEKRCTQGLSIIRNIEDTFSRCESSRFSLEARRTLIRNLLDKDDYKIIGIYPSGGYSQKVYSYCEDVFGKERFEFELFDSAENRWGEIENGLKIHSPDELLIIKPDCVLVSNYKFQEEIAESLKQYEGIYVIKLHAGNDIPWIY